MRIQHCHVQSQHCHDPPLSNMEADELHVDSIVREHHVCSTLFGNLRKFEIALRILSIAKLHAQFRNCIPSTQFGNRINYVFSAL